MYKVNHHIFKFNLHSVKSYIFIPNLQNIRSWHIVLTFFCKLIRTPSNLTTTTNDHKSKSGKKLFRRMNTIMLNALTKPTFSIKSLVLNTYRIEFRCYTWYTQQRKADQGQHNRLQQVFYDECKSKQLLRLSTSSNLIRATSIQRFGTSPSLQNSSKRKMVNWIERRKKLFERKILSAKSCWMVLFVYWFLSPIRKRFYFLIVFRVKGFDVYFGGTIIFSRYDCVELKN